MSNSTDVCPLCEGQHWKYDYTQGEVPVPIQCKCVSKAIWTSFMGTEIFRAKHVRSELYLPEKDPETQKVTGDRTRDNLFLKGTWDEVCRHLKWVLYLKKNHQPSFNYLIVEDQRLLSVWLGKESYNSRSKAEREERASFNSVQDLVSDPNLLIIRLGMMRSHNKAAAKVLLDALLVRLGLDRPTWVVEGINYFGEGHRFWSQEAENFVKENYEVLDLGGDVEKERQLLAEAAAGFLEETSSFDSSTPRRSEAPPRIWDSKEAFKSKSKPQYRKPGKGNQGGGLPTL